MTHDAAARAILDACPDTGRFPTSEGYCYFEGDVLAMLDQARLQGWNECREAAAKVADRKAERAKEHEMFPAYCLNAVASTAEDLAAELRNLTPSTPESRNVG